MDSRERRGNHYFSCFQLPSANKLSLSSLRFLSLFLLKLIVIPRLIAYETYFPGRFAFFCIFIDAITSELLTLTFQDESDIVRIWAHIKLSPFYCKTNSLTNWDLHHYPPLSIYHAYPALPLSHHLSSLRLPKCIRNEGSFIFTRNWKKNNKKYFQSVEIGNDMLIYINIKRVF